MPKSILDSIICGILRSEKSVQQISRESGVNRNTISSWINQNTSPSIANAEAVLNTIGYTLTLRELENADGGKG